MLAPQLDNHEIRKGKYIGVTISINNHRLFVGNIPKNRGKEELFEEFSKHARECSCADFKLAYITVMRFFVTTLSNKVQ